MKKRQDSKITVINILLADDHPLILAGFRARLTDYPDIKVIAETGEAGEILSLYSKLKPDVVVLDIMFAGQKKTGLDVLKEILDHDPSAKVIVLSQFDQDSLVKEVYKLGALAFCKKNVAVDHLVAAIHRAHGGQRYYPPELAERLADLATQPKKTPPELLTDREMAILKLLTQGKVSHEIGVELGISIRTVAYIVKIIKTKLGVARQRDLIGKYLDYLGTDPWSGS